MRRDRSRTVGLSQIKEDGRERDWGRGNIKLTLKRTFSGARPSSPERGKEKLITTPTKDKPSGIKNHNGKGDVPKDKQCQRCNSSSNWETSSLPYHQKKVLRHAKKSHGSRSGKKSIGRIATMNSQIFYMVQGKRKQVEGKERTDTEKRGTRLALSSSHKYKSVGKYINRQSEDK